MSWSTPQANEIIERFWMNEIVTCPEHGAPLRLKLLKLLGGDYQMFAGCPVRGENRVFRRGDDPRRSFFRPWTASEVNDLTKRALSGDRPDCPVCGAAIECVPAAKNAGHLLIRCLRCAGSNQWHPVFGGAKVQGIQRSHDTDRDQPSTAEFSPLKAGEGGLHSSSTAP